MKPWPSAKVTPYSNLSPCTPNTAGTSAFSCSKWTAATCMGPKVQRARSTPGASALRLLQKSVPTSRHPISGGQSCFFQSYWHDWDLPRVLWITVNYQALHSVSRDPTALSSKTWCSGILAPMSDFQCQGLSVSKFLGPFSTLDIDLSRAVGNGEEGAPMSPPLAQFDLPQPSYQYHSPWLATERSRFAPHISK